MVYRFQRWAYRDAERKHAAIVQGIGARQAPAVFHCSRLYDFLRLDDFKKVRLLTMGMLAIREIQEVRQLIVRKPAPPCFS